MSSFWLLEKAKWIRIKLLCHIPVRRALPLEYQFYDLMCVKGLDQPFTCFTHAA